MHYGMACGKIGYERGWLRVRRRSAISERNEVQRTGNPADPQGMLLTLWLV